MKIPVWLNTQLVAPAWLSGECAARTLHSTSVSTSIGQHVKTAHCSFLRRSVCFHTYMLVELGQTRSSPTWTVYQLCLLLEKVQVQSDAVRRQTQDWQRITNLCVNPHDYVQLESITGIWNVLCSSFYLLLPVSLSCPPQISAFHPMLADSYDRVRRQGGAGRVCVFHGTTSEGLY